MKWHEVAKSKSTTFARSLQPCVLKVERKVAMVMHVDDILFLGEQSWINNVFLPGLEKEFRLTSTVVDRTTGASFEFFQAATCC